MRVTSHTHLAIATIILVFAFTCYGASVSEPNAAEANLTAAKEVAAERDTATQIKKNDELSDSTRAQIERLAKEYYKDTADRQERALYTIIAIVAVFVIYVVFKDRGEYNKAVAEAREANKEAREASAGARDYEEKAHERLRSIGKEIAAKLEEIEVKSTAKLEQMEAKGKALITDLTQEAKKQRQVSREEAEERQSTFSLLTKSARAYNDKKYELAVGYLKQILKIDPQNADALSNWGAVLIGQAKTKKGKAKRQLLNEAREKCLKTESIKPGEGAYNLACVHALLGEEKECQKWLKIVEQGTTLTNRLITQKYVMADPDLKSVRDKEWFKQILWKGD